MADRIAKSELFEQFARVGKALASSKRLELLDLLAQGERTVDQLARAADLGLTSASSHLQILKQAHLVTTRRDATRIFYGLAGDDVAALYAQLRRVAQVHVTDVEPARVAYLGLPDAHPTEEVAREELLARATAGDVVVLDVRPAVEFIAGHIPGAVSIPLDQLTSRLDELPAETEIVAYCRGAYCVMAYDAVRLLHSQGRRARRLVDGMLEWRLDGLPVEPGAA
ncbi:MAG: metalloregulator ArsR/SmtB family transcription factor [Candidatus Dormibacteria bacterium]